MAENLNLPAKPEIDVLERGAPREGVPQTSDRRLYCQLQVFTGAKDSPALTRALEQSGLEGVLYQDLNDPSGAGVLVMSETPDRFVNEARSLFTAAPFSQLGLKPDLTMFGRTYAMGREPDLEDRLLRRPRRVALNPASPWAVWYPLRRKPEFELLSRAEQGKILMEHAAIGIGYGELDLAHDIRLACYGLDRCDNEFVIGLIGKDLYPLSRVVQDMRRTQQTAKYIQSLGPFFVGKKIWASQPPS